MQGAFDRRLTPFSGRIAHVSLAGKVDAPLTEGRAEQVTSALTFLYTAPFGAVDRQLLHGDRVITLDSRDGYSFVMAEKDGFCGWMISKELGPRKAVTHRIISPLTHLYPAPKVQAVPLMALSLNALIEIEELQGAWAKTPEGYIPARHLAPLDHYAQDPVSVAESLLHAPYYWGGNSVMGVDCSGLVQLAYHAAGKTMAGDSDLQAKLGQEIAEGHEQRGDLIFWKGHVALISAKNQILHANGYHMSVAYEPLDAAIARIAAAGDGPVIARKRP